MGPCIKYNTERSGGGGGISCGEATSICCMLAFYKINCFYLFFPGAVPQLLPHTPHTHGATHEFGVRVFGFLCHLSFSYMLCQRNRQLVMAVAKLYIYTTRNELMTRPEVKTLKWYFVPYL